MKEQAQKLLIEIIQKYFGPQFMQNRFNFNDPGAFEKVDFRDGKYEQLQLERYSPIGQVRAILAIDGLNFILD